jgi:hypothetical protein
MVILSDRSESKDLSVSSLRRAFPRFVEVPTIHVGKPGILLWNAASCCRLLFVEACFDIPRLPVRRVFMAFAAALSRPESPC